MTTETVRSAQNPRVKALRELKQAKARAETGSFLAEGEKLCAEALLDAEVALLIVDEEKADRYARLIEQAKSVLLVTGAVMDSICDARTPQGVAARVRLPKSLALTQATGALLALDGVQDPGNMGTMLRTAEAAGFTGALLSPECADAFAPKAVRATMGSVFRLPVWRGQLAEGLETLRSVGFQVVSAELSGTPFQAARHEIAGHFALVIGSEAHGISDSVLPLCDLRVSLPMRGRAESLNAAVAAGILMYGLMEARG